MMRRGDHNHDENGKDDTQLMQEYEVRRGNRKRKMTTTIVDGQTVKLSNMYDLETGEKSVWDQELDTKNKKEDGGTMIDTDTNGSAYTVKTMRVPVQVKNKEKKPNKNKNAIKGGEGQLHDMDTSLHSSRQISNMNLNRVKTLAEQRRAQFARARAQILAPFVPWLKSECDRDGIVLDAENQAESLSKFIPPIPSDSDGGLLPQPIGLCGQGTRATIVMRDYQLQGLSFLHQNYHRGTGCILADEMGLGKTLQTLSFLQQLRQEAGKTITIQGGEGVGMKLHPGMQASVGAPGPDLVVVPLSVINSWKSEASRWVPDIRVVKLHTSDPMEADRIRNTLSQPDTYDLCLTTYEMLKANLNFLTRNLTWRVLILDEGHKVKNSESEIHVACCKVRAIFRVILTGTPIQNNLKEMHALIKFLMPDLFTDSEPFGEAFNIDKKKVVCDDDMVSRAHFLLRLFCLRRLKTEVELDMPKKTEIVLKCPLSHMQTFWYKSLLLMNAKAIERAAILHSGGTLDQDTGATTTEIKKLRSLFMQLRKASLHPYLFDGAEPDFDGTTDEGIVNASGKMQVLDLLLAALFKNKHRVIIFSQFTRVLNILEDYLSLREYVYCRLDGQTNRVQRWIDIAKFNKKKSDTFVFLLSTRAGGLGVNLQTADTCIIFDSDWNPQSDLQAMARVHRIGQKKPVHVYRLISNGTVEEKILQRAQRKLFLDNVVTRQSTMVSDKMMKENADNSEEVSDGALLSSLTFGAGQILKRGGKDDFGSGDIKLPSEEEVFKIIDRTESKPDPLTQIKTEDGNHEIEKGVVSYEEARAALDEEWVDSLLFQGFDYSQYRDKAVRDIAHDWCEEVASKKKRDHNSNYVDVQGHMVHKLNMYELNAGEPSVFGQEVHSDEKSKAKQQKSKVQRAGRDYDHMDVCLVCWDGGDLICCDGCPAVYHPKCIGLDVKKIPKSKPWLCPQHSCDVCDRKAHAVGGLLFRCVCCPRTFCEEHLPEHNYCDNLQNMDDDDEEKEEENEGMTLLGECDRYIQLGQHHPKQACFIHCGLDCKKFESRANNIFLNALYEREKIPCPTIASSGGILKDKVLTGEREHLTANASPMNGQHGLKHNHMNVKSEKDSTPKKKGTAGDISLFSPLYEGKALDLFANKNCMGIQRQQGIMDDLINNKNNNNTISTNTNSHIQLPMVLNHAASPSASMEM